MMLNAQELAIGRNRRGLSLIEGLFAASLVAVAFLAISNLFPVGYANVTYSGNQTLAQNYAQQKIEQLKNLSFTAIDTTNCSTTAEDLGNGLSRKCLLTNNVGVPGPSGPTGPLTGELKRVQVTVTWPKQGRVGSISIDTMFTR